MLSGEGCDVAETTRMLAQKQPLIQRVRNSSLVERLCAENLTGLNLTPKLRQQKCWVGERCMRGETVAQAAVECIEVRMPE